MKVMETDDSSTTLGELKSLIREFCEVRQWDPYHGPKDLAIGAVTEASELLELFRFVGESEALAKVADPEEREAIGDELADALYFLLRFAQLYGFDLSDCVRRKLVKNAAKYPVGSR